MRVYDGRRRRRHDITAGISRVDEGIYEVPYTLPLGLDYLVYEFAGVDAAGDPVLGRATIAPIWSR